MQLDTPAADRLLKFCGKLPTMPADITQAAQELRFTLQCLSQRRAEIERDLLAGACPPQELGLLRCEFEAIGSARDVLGAIWLCQFGTELAPA